MSDPSEKSYRSYRELMSELDTGKVLIIHMADRGNYLIWRYKGSNLIAYLNFDDIGQGYYASNCEHLGSVEGLERLPDFTEAQAVTIHARFTSKRAALRVILPLFAGVRVGSESYLRILQTPYAQQKAVSA